MGHQRPHILGTAIQAGLLHGINGITQELVRILLAAEADVLGNLCRRGKNQPQHVLQQMQALPPSLGAETLGFEPPQPNPDIRLVLAMGEAPHNS